MQQYVLRQVLQLDTDLPNPQLHRQQRYGERNTLSRHRSQELSLQRLQGAGSRGAFMAGVHTQKDPDRKSD